MTQKRATIGDENDQVTKEQLVMVGGRLLLLTVKWAVDRGKGAREWMNKSTAAMNIGGLDEGCCCIGSVVLFLF